MDAVSVCSPNKFHGEVTIAALKAGKHVYYFGATRTEGNAGMKPVLGGKGANATLFPLGRLRHPLAAVAFLFALCSSVLPVLAVTAMAFMRFWAPYAMKAENLTWRNFRYMLFEYPQVWPSAQSVSIAQRRPVWTME